MERGAEGLGFLGQAAIDMSIEACGEGLIEPLDGSSLGGRKSKNGDGI